MKNTELMNKVMTEDELDIVAGGGPRVRVPLHSPLKKLKDVIGAIHDAKKVITCIIKQISPKDTILRKHPTPDNITEDMRRIDKLLTGA